MGRGHGRSAGWWGRVRQLFLCARIWDFTVWGRGTGIEVMGINLGSVCMCFITLNILQHSALIESLSDNTIEEETNLKLKVSDSWNF
jgi:hypothetical protein